MDDFPQTRCPEKRRAKKNDAEELEEWIRDLVASALPLIVEGREDAKALRNIGVTNPIIILNTGPRYKVIEHIVKTHKHVVILTDFDREGKRLYGMLNRELAPFGVHVDARFREELQKTRLDQVEGIASYYRRIASCSRITSSPP
jgi:5S rRNA maturation endonuclease (ribonuclease M5)